MAENMGLLVRDADKKLRSVADMQNANTVMEFFESLSKRDQERLLNEMAIKMVVAGAARSAPQKKAGAPARRRG